MPSVTITNDLNKLFVLIGKHQKQIPFALSQAVNSVAFDLKREYARATRLYFDRPTPATQRGWRVLKSNKRQRPIRGKVYAAAHTAPYLKRQVVQSGPQARPIPRRARINQYGNLPRTYIKTRLNRKGFFVGVPANHPGKPYGVYQRTGPAASMPAGRRLKMHVEFDQKVFHTPSFPMQRIGLVYVRKHLENRFYANYRKAVRNMR